MGDRFVYSVFQKLGIDRLNVAERLALVQDIWDSLEDDIERMPLNEEERTELQLRLDDDEAHPDDTLEWENIKAAALRRWSET
jgi:putative addiction module component (TIGR02574 family)